MNKLEILEVLDYYADPSNWDPKSHWNGCHEDEDRTEVVVVPIAEVDAGRKAKELAKKIRSE